MSTVSWLTFFIFIILVSGIPTFGRLYTPKVFDVKMYGAVPDGKTDNIVAFTRAWNDACAWDGESRVYIPLGTYLLGQVTFSGECKGLMAFLIRGILIAPTNRNQFYNQPTWITFYHVNNLFVGGGGTLDGQGAAAWIYNDCATNQNCVALPSTLTFDFVQNGKIENIKSINSKNTHFTLFECINVNISKVTIVAPENSPNTDGIKIGGKSTQIRILDSVIGTGDDCIAILSSSSSIDIANVFCGPGHGISIGSLGDNNSKVSQTVSQISVRHCTLRGTTNGVRIKTKAPSNTGVALNITYEHIIMDAVNNPIIIDQLYGAHQPILASSNIQIDGITYRNISGTSQSEVAENFSCSNTFPCKNIVTDNINLSLVGGKGGGQTTSVCSNVNGVSYGQQNPPSCL